MDVTSKMLIFRKKGLALQKFAFLSLKGFMAIKSAHKRAHMVGDLQILR